MKEHVVNSLNNFICGWYIDNTEICDKLIQYHTNSNPRPGEVGNGLVVPTVKTSIDCHITDQKLFNEYWSFLGICRDLYIEKYEFCNKYSPWEIRQSINIQQYLPGMGFYGWHCERAQASELSAARHLVFMTYLNDVTEGGETEFYYQSLKIRPTKGLTLIWPVDWTFTHRGIPSNTQTKYITTGWFHYV
jgi:hypothetical protein